VNPAKRLEQCKLQIGCDTCGMMKDIKDVLAYFERKELNIFLKSSESIGQNSKSNNSARANVWDEEKNLYQRALLRPTARPIHKIQKVIKRGRKPWTASHSILLKGCLRLFENDFDKIRLFLPDFNDATIKKKMMLLGWKQYVLNDCASLSDEIITKHEISHSDNMDFNRQRMPISSTSSSKLIVPQPSLARTLMKITSIDMDGQFAEQEPIHQNLPSIESFDFSKKQKSFYQTHFAPLLFQTGSAIFKEKLERFPQVVCPFNMGISPAKQIKLDDSIFRFDMARTQNPNFQSNGNKKMTIDSIAEMSNFTFNLAGVHRQTNKILENKENPEKSSSFIRFSSLVDFYANEKLDSNF
jgi:hypothetical protein